MQNKSHCHYVCVCRVRGGMGGDINTVNFAIADIFVIYFGYRTQATSCTVEAIETNKALKLTSDYLDRHLTVLNNITNSLYVKIHFLITTETKIHF